MKNNGKTDEEIETYMKMQGKAEFTFGADENTDDNYDVSAMLIGGCGAHTNPWNNDFGFTDLTSIQDNSQVCQDGNKIYNNNQTMHKKSDIANTIKGGGKTETIGDDSHIYITMIRLSTILLVLQIKSASDWRNHK